MSRRLKVILGDLSYPNSKLNGVDLTAPLNRAYFDFCDYDAHKGNLAGITLRKMIRYSWCKTILHPIQGAWNLNTK